VETRCGTPKVQIAYRQSLEGSYTAKEKIQLCKIEKMPSNR